MKRMKRAIIEFLLKIYQKKIFEMCGNIAERFHEKDSGEYDDLQEKFNYWITAGIKDF